MRRPQLTRFFCQEMLCDYASGKLTADRKKDIDEFLKTDDVCRGDFEKLKTAINYCGLLRQIQTPDAWVERWRNLPPALAKRLSDLEMKLVSKLWTALPYCVGLAVVTLGLILLKPWKMIFSRDTVVWSAADLKSTLPNISFADLTPSLSFDVVSLPTPTPTPSSEPSPTEAKPKAVAAEKKAKELYRGDLYNASMDLDDLDENTDLVKQNILKLKGERVGKASLGSHREEDESYFDFTLPESNLEAFQDFLATLGPVRIEKQNHPVVMPAGKIRIILILKENAKNDTEAPAP